MMDKSAVSVTAGATALRGFTYAPTHHLAASSTTDSSTSFPQANQILHSTDLEVRSMVILAMARGKTAAAVRVAPS